MNTNIQTIDTPVNPETIAIQFNPDEVVTLPEGQVVAIQTEDEIGSETPERVLN